MWVLAERSNHIRSAQEARSLYTKAQPVATQGHKRCLASCNVVDGWACKLRLSVRIGETQGDVADTPWPACGPANPAAVAIQQARRGTPAAESAQCGTAPGWSPPKTAKWRRTTAAYSRVSRVSPVSAAGDLCRGPACSLGLYSKNLIRHCPHRDLSEGEGVQAGAQGIHIRGAAAAGRSPAVLGQPDKQGFGHAAPPDTEHSVALRHLDDANSMDDVLQQNPEAHR